MELRGPSPIARCSQIAPSMEFFDELTDVLGRSVRVHTPGFIKYLWLFQMSFYLCVHILTRTRRALCVYFLVSVSLWLSPKSKL